MLAVTIDGSLGYGRVTSRARCRYSGESRRGGAVAEPPTTAPLRPRRLVQRFLGTLIVATSLSAALAAAEPDPPPNSAPAPSDPVVSSIAEWEQETGNADLALALLRTLEQSGDNGRRLEYARRVLRQTSLGAADEAKVLNHLISSATAAADWSDRELVDAGIAALLDRVEAPELRTRLGSSHAAYLTRQGRFADAERAARRAIDDADAQPAEFRFNLYNSLGVALAQQGRFDEAFETLVAALRIREQGGLADSAMLLQNLGGLSIYLGRHEAAIEYNQRALELLDDNAATLPSVLSNIAASEVELGRLDAARTRLERAIAIGERRGQPSISSIGNLGYVLRELGQFEEALALFRRQIELERATDSAGTQAIAWKNVGETLVRMNRRDEADSALETALQLYREADIKPKRLELYPVMIDNLAALGRDRRALDLMREYKSLSDEMISAESAERIAALEAGLELERRERELALVERDRVLAEAELGQIRAEQARERGFRNLLLAVLSGAILLLVLLWRTARMRGRSNRLLAEKNSEIDQQHKVLEGLNRSLEQRSQEDELTGLFNRRFMRQLVEDLERETATGGAAAAAAPSPYLMLLIDLDLFKQINDQWGHPVGDLALMRVGDALRECAEPGDLLMRWGGEEFLWLCAAASTDQAGPRCLGLQQALRRLPLMIEGQAVELGFSAGATLLELDHVDPAQALQGAIRIADAALYEAKSSGRGRYVCLELDVEHPAPHEVPELIRSGRLRRLAGPIDGQSQD